MSVGKYLPGLAFLLVSLNVAHAQDSLKHSTLSINNGVNFTSNKDQFQSPYTYKGTYYLVNSTYTRSNAKGQQIVDFTFSQGKFGSIVSPKAENALLMFDYDYLFNIKTKNANRKFVPSLGFGLHTLLSNTNYLPEVESSKNYLTGGSYLTLSGNFTYHINKRNALRMQFGLPIFGLVYRPDFEINGKTLIKTNFIGQSIQSSAKLEYAYKLNPKLSLLATYTYNYFSYDEPRSITILQNGLLIGIRRTF
jgi:hypothetical protein